MKPSFHARVLNGPFDDPGLYVRVLREGRAIMFDTGFTAGLSSRDILKTHHIFVSHAHVDHFIGFDNILRVSLKKKSPLKLYGPEGFIDRIEGKLKGYTWNLLDDNPLTVEVAEVKVDAIQNAVFRAGNAFMREDLDPRPFNGVLLSDSLCRVSAAILDHQIPCLAFCVEEDYHINIDKSKLEKMDLPVGTWLGELKSAIRRGQKEGEFTINGRTVLFSELKDIATVTKGQKLSYVVDAIGSDANVKKIVDLVRGSDLLYIEAYFLHKDKERAVDRYHLTAKQAGRIAREAGVGRIELMHFSPRYMDCPEALIGEAKEEFARGKFWTSRNDKTNKYEELLEAQHRVK